ncbi:MAG: hypothetical protein HY046_14605 [Acidobacteria bacterium]|nr:hypothetical protein [Acidobacteriota bacterium]
MKIFRTFSISLALFLLSASVVNAQDLSRYRDFSFGMSLVQVAGRAGQTVTDASLIQSRPALIQELTWRPQYVYPINVGKPEAVQQVLFSFYNGELYKMSVKYDREATTGFTADDMVQAISAKYGTATVPAPMAGIPSYNSAEKVIARLEDSLYSYDLTRTPVSTEFQLIMYSKPVESHAINAIAEGSKLDKQEAPKIEAARLKLESDNLEISRQKNRKSFRP